MSDQTPTDAAGEPNTAPERAPAEAADPGRTIVLALGTAPKHGATVAALRLAHEAVQRGHQVAVYAYGDGVRVGAEGCPTGAYVREFIGEGADDGPVRWIVDGSDPRTSTQVPGVQRGDGSDLWRLIRAGDVVLGVTA
ncbi:MAG: hypothetical protein EA388_01965 [Nitriliruptor sp.]|nr:MAG: hypothetical protein EA388_01965 [Nitriliruptor sp.]